MSHLFRCSLPSGLVAEFAAPLQDSRRVLIFCDGLPSLPQKTSVLSYWAKRGYWVFHPRYYGTWESGGTFLNPSPERMVSDLLDALPGGFEDVWSREFFSVQPKSVFVVGASFGGTAALLASLDPRVTKAVALAPVVDWTHRSEAEPNEFLLEVIRKGYGGAYRFDSNDWDRMARGEFFQPSSIIEKLDPKKILIVHAQDDDVVLAEWTQKFARDVGCAYLPLKKGGHASASWTMRWRLSRNIQKFFRQ